MNKVLKGLVAVAATAAMAIAGVAGRLLHRHGGRDYF